MTKVTSLTSRFSFSCTFFLVLFLVWWLTKEIINSSKKENNSLVNVMGWPASASSFPSWKIFAHHQKKSNWLFIYCLKSGNSIYFSHMCDVNIRTFQLKAGWHVQYSFYGRNSLETFTYWSLIGFFCKFFCASFFATRKLCLCTRL